MKYINMPGFQLTGKITNNHIKTQYIPKSHTLYAIIMLYVLRDNHALLYPITFLNTHASQIVKHAQQGDLITVNVAVSPVSSRYTFNCNLVVTKWNFAEQISTDTRNRTVKQNFPIIPDNYPVRTQQSKANIKSRDVKSDANHHLSQAEVNPKSVEIIPPHAQSQSTSSNVSKTISNKKRRTIHIKPHIISSHNNKSTASTTSHSHKRKGHTYDWMEEMNKDLGMTFDKMH